MTAGFPRALSRGLVPNSVFFFQSDGSWVVRVVLDELEVLEDLAFLVNLTPVRPVVVDGEHNRTTLGCNFLPLNIFDALQQRERTAFHFAEE